MPAPGTAFLRTSVGEVQNAGRKISARPASLQVEGLTGTGGGCLRDRGGAAEPRDEAPSPILYLRALDG